MIHIFIAATGDYDKLMDKERAESFNNLFPSEEKTFNYISDTDRNIKSIRASLNNSYVDFKYYHICNLVYPFVNLFKFNYIMDAVKLYGYNLDDIFMYCDATSLILGKDQSFWNNTLNVISSHDITYSTNPYIYCPSISDEIDERSKHHVTLEQLKTEPEKWSQTSFLTGHLYGLKKLNNYMNQLLLDDIRYSDNLRIKQCILPNFMEQHYFNYIFYNLDKYDLDVHHDKYITYNPQAIEQSTIMLCHYKNWAIAEKRNSTIYKEGI